MATSKSKNLNIFILVFFIAAFWLAPLQKVGAETVYLKCNHVFLKTKNGKTIRIRKAVMRLGLEKIEIFTLTNKTISARKDAFSVVKCTGPHMSQETALKLKEYLAYKKPGKNPEKEDGKKSIVSGKIGVLDVLKFSAFLLIH